MQAQSLTSSETYYGIPKVSNSQQSQSCHIVCNTSQLLVKKNDRSRLVNTHSSKGNVWKENSLFTKIKKQASKQTKKLTKKPHQNPLSIISNTWGKNCFPFFYFFSLQNKNQRDFSLSKVESLPTSSNFPSLKQTYPWNKLTSPLNISLSTQTWVSQVQIRCTSSLGQFFSWL